MTREEHDRYLEKRVTIKSVSKSSYKTKELVGASGTIKNTSSDEFGVLVDNRWNPSSAKGLYWFASSELKFLNNESEDIIMEGFKYVAIVNLLDDYNKKDYAFALYEDDYWMIDEIEKVNAPAMVIVNARAKNNRLLATVKKIMPIEDYSGTKITAEVVGTVNMNNHFYRETEKARLEELAKKRAAIEAELEKEINKRKSIEYYEEMAKQYADNPRLAELVGELRGLGA